MAVIIQNISVEYGRGLQQYELRINNKHIAYFEHTFEDGLAVCLEKAALAERLTENNQCDGCLEKVPIVNGIHLMKYPSGPIVCTRDRYK